MQFRAMLTNKSWLMLVVIGLLMLRFSAVPIGNVVQRGDTRVIWDDAPFVAAAISADGRQLVYVSPGNMGQLYVRDLRSDSSRRLTGSDPADPGRPNGRLALSPDGKVVAYGWLAGFGREPSLRVISLDGTPVRIPHKPDDLTIPRDWSPDGKQLLGLGRTGGMSNLGIALMSVADGAVRILKGGIDRGEQVSHTTFSRDGRYVAYDFPAQGTSGERDIFLITVEGAQQTRLIARTADDWFPIFTPDGQGLFFLSARQGPDEAWFLRIADGKPQGAPELLSLTVGGSIVGFTQNGSFVYAGPVGGRQALWMTENPLLKSGGVK